MDEEGKETVKGTYKLQNNLKIKTGRITRLKEGTLKYRETIDEVSELSTVG
jgi:hypothetical protein